MIPTDAASRIRLITPELPSGPQPTPPAQQITDVLSDLVPGQRILAQIQLLLPNGTYRAMVGQRDVTLALPFSAKAGDALELEVVESEGKVTLAFVANRGQGESQGQQSAATTLSRAGRLIGDLLGEIGNDGKRAQPAPLNGNQPLVKTMPALAADLAPILKDALSKSGMFYESHQAKWVEGKLPLPQLLAQPQGKLSAEPLLAAVSQALARPDHQVVITRESSQPPSLAHATPEAAEEAGESHETQSLKASAQGEQAKPGTTASRDSQTGAPVGQIDGSGSANRPSSAVHPQIAPLVQQQLDALSTQTYVWQGQIWPGQQMHWEISEDGHDRGSDPEDAPERWQTRLKLTLPHLGGVEAILRLRAGSAVELALTADNEDSRSKLVAAGGALQEQLEAAGLSLATWSVSHAEAAG